MTLRTLAATAITAPPAGASWSPPSTACSATPRSAHQPASSASASELAGLRGRIAALESQLAAARAAPPVRVIVPPPPTTTTVACVRVPGVLAVCPG